MARKRFIVEAVWSGYNGAQRRVCHRTVETLFRAGYEALNWHPFSDGTGLRISVRDAKPRERVQVINGYGSLLRNAAMDKWSELKDSERAKGAEHGR
jgi:hypothetical protein